MSNPKKTPVFYFKNSAKGNIFDHFAKLLLGSAEQTGQHFQLTCTTQTKPSLSTKQWSASAKAKPRQSEVDAKRMHVF